MKRSLLASIVVLSVALLTNGCASLQKKTQVPRPRAFALAVTVNGMLQPTPQQWALIQSKFSAALAARGWVLVNDISLADHILRVDFTPNPSDPESSGRATILGVRRNPYSVVATRGTSPYPVGYGFAHSYGSNWPYSNFYSGNYYGYGSIYNEGYWSMPSTFTPVVHTAPPTPRQHPGGREYCPPEFHSRPSDFVAHLPDSGGTRERSRPSDFGTWRDERAIARAEAARSSARSDYSSSYSNNSFNSGSSSYSPSYSSSSTDYSASSSSSSASSASAVAAVASEAPPVAGATGPN